MKKLPSVYSFDNYREYLRAYYGAMKEGEARFTFERFSRLAGIKSPNLLKLVMDGHKNLSNASLLGFAQALNLHGEEKEYFFNLVHFCQSESEMEKIFFRNKLKNARPKRPIKVATAAGKSGLYDNIFITTAACILQGREIGEEVKTLMEQLGIPRQMAKEIFDHLSRTNFLYIENDAWAVDINHVIFHEKIPSTVLKRFLRDQLLFSLSAFEADQNNEVKMLSHVMNVNPEDLPEIREILDTELARINEKFERTKGIPFQINCQSFRITPAIGKCFLRKTGQL